MHAHCTRRAERPDPPLDQKDLFCRSIGEAIIRRRRRRKRGRRKELPFPLSSFLIGESLFSYPFCMGGHPCPLFLKKSVKCVLLFFPLSENSGRIALICDSNIQYSTLAHLWHSALFSSRQQKAVARSKSERERERERGFPASFPLSREEFALKERSLVRRRKQRGGIGKGGGGRPLFSRKMKLPLLAGWEEGRGPFIVEKEGCGKEKDSCSLPLFGAPHK